MFKIFAFFRILCAGIAAVLLCSPSAVQAQAAQGADASDEFTTIEWIELIPPKELDALMNPPDYIAQVEEGSLEDQVSELGGSSADDAEDAYQQALVSTNVNEELNGKSVRIPGFVVPLEFNDDQIVTQFFLVPYFGACIHVPPPPPNQIILVNSPEGLQLDALYSPFWISGVVKTSITENDMAVSAYVMDLKAYELYEY